MAPGALGSYGPEAQAVVAAKQQSAPVLEGELSAGTLGAQPASGQGAVEGSPEPVQQAAEAVPPEDDMPDPDAVPVPEV